MKIVNTQLAQSQGYSNLELVREEIGILQNLGDHPCLVQLLDVDETPDSIRLVMDLCEGGELYDRVLKKQRYLEQEARIVTRNLLGAVAFVHSKTIMHRDLKPENILLVNQVSSTDIKVSDFGLAKRCPGLTHPRSRTICGSDFYLAPEVIKEEEYGREIDVWAVGVITYVVLSGSLPFYHMFLHKLYRQIVERDLSFPEQPWKGVSKGAQDFIVRLLQPSPKERLSADHALGHPWLSGVGGASQTSFSTAGAMMPPRSPTAIAHPLEHAHKV